MTAKFEYEKKKSESSDESDKSGSDESSDTDSGDTEGDSGEENSETNDDRKRVKRFGLEIDGSFTYNKTNTQQLNSTSFSIKVAYEKLSQCLVKNQ